MTEFIAKLDAQMAIELLDATGERASVSVASRVRRLLEIVESARGTIRPMHRRSPDPHLRSYFVLDIPEETTVGDMERFARDLSTIAESFYVKPKAAPP